MEKIFKQRQNHFHKFHKSNLFPSNRTPLLINYLLSTIYKQYNTSLPKCKKENKKLFKQTK